MTQTAIVKLASPMTKTFCVRDLQPGDIALVVESPNKQDRGRVVVSTGWKHALILGAPGGLSYDLSSHSNDEVRVRLLQYPETVTISFAPPKEE